MSERSAELLLEDMLESCDRILENNLITQPFYQIHRNNLKYNYL